ncbi:nose resistant to fluoxetine protein 6-like [Wyeomyia smithii]|uniref:nose resistant to fluoxetine protein 6-like n=1 Tax=Wyeomyia smithii TaxID=174621 RepID=UPI002467B1C1|nr:nose resistant to fluoxetine protein 6-like [Wyeomyia smithii]
MPGIRLKFKWLLKAIVMVSPALLFLCAVEQTSESEKSEYDSMPPLYHFEDKSTCLSENFNNTYCVARSIIVPDSSSELWAVIEKHSKQDTDYRHYLLDRGVCLNTCAELVSGLSDEQRKNYDQRKIDVEPPYIYDASYIPGMDEYKRKYGRLINICLNYQLRQDYNLSSYSVIEHCMTSAELNKPLTLYHALFVILLGAIVILVIHATFRDNRVVANVNNNLVAIETDSKEPENNIWMEFSLKRSLQRLLAKPKTKVQQDLAFMESVRVVTVLIITIVHTFMSFGASPMANPRTLEHLYRNAVVRMASAIFPFLVHTFFTIGGMLLSVHFLDFIKTGAKFRWWYFFAAVFNRYLRMIPLYFIMWLYQVSWFDRLGVSGPTAHRVVDVEMQFCKQNGWSNFLFINNYYKYNEPCMQQTWSMASDFQFFVVGMLIMMLLWRFPKLTKVMIVAMMSTSIVVPIINNYTYNFVGVILLNFKHLRFMLLHYEWMLRDYVRAHPHTSSYFAGIIAGMVYHKAQKDSRNPAQLIIYQYMKRIAPLMVILLSIPATFFYDSKPSQPSLWMAIYASAHRNFFGIMCGVGLLYGATDGAYKIPAILRHPVVLAIGRLSFCVYLAQFNSLRFSFINVEGYGFPLNGPNFIKALVVCISLSYGIGFLLCTTIEIPISAIIKRLQGTSSKKTK